MRACETLRVRSSVWMRLHVTKKKTEHETSGKKAREQQRSLDVKQRIKKEKEKETHN